jgi:glycosyltransferase involved in cell wall biosynthesis
MSSIGVVISTFGDDKWRSKGESLVAYTQDTSGASNVLHTHGDCLASARNAGARNIGTDYIIFLDADDKLGDDYCRVLRDSLIDGNVLYQPETIGWYTDGSTDETSNFIPDRNMKDSNNLVIGTAVRAEFCVEFRSRFISFGRLGFLFTNDYGRG